MSKHAANFIESATKQFQYYKQLGSKTISQLSDEQLFWQSNEASNSIAIIVNHLSGNMKSRWTDFLVSDGEKEWRNRDLEFENVIKDRDQLLIAWEDGWTCVFEALESLNKENFDQLVYIRNVGHSVTEAVQRQLAHYAYHIGQMVFVGKICLGDEWSSLSIPKGASKEYNKERFSEEKKRRHFTDHLLDKKS